ncbi:hypothetical protein TCAL_17180 [Tigriopus californicus]|uniref:Mitochondrial inner membrane protease ATP23 n=1 Tax=Tigriopus californicus TaxID=6832 RepID=A0A553N8D7_TIGCA|nr:mitochondrial inner membrane protease ATP23 homolog [Tigriopus californicus]TRY61697.1 hypothetical protein TCAL_17180 [Tigriopus californicus]
MSNSTANEVPSATSFAAPAEDESAQSAQAASPGAVILEQSPTASASFADLYPFRRGTPSRPITSWEKFLGHERTGALRNVCEENVLYCAQSLPMVRHMLQALKAAGCPVMLQRHLSCETCQPGNDAGVNHGGYDELHNQVFICSNNAVSVGDVHATLIRGLLGMFEACTARVDYRNVDHLACLEIKQANLTSCNFLNYLSQKFGRLGLAGEHARCVKATARYRLMNARFVDETVAHAAVERVFKQCYQDLEPIGRRCGSAADIELARNEAYLFGHE